MTDSNNHIHLPRVMQKQVGDQDIDQNNHSDQPNPQIVVHYQTVGVDESEEHLVEDHLIEEEPYEEEIDDSNIISEVIETTEIIDDKNNVVLATSGIPDDGPPSTIIQKPAIKKYLNPSTTSSTRTPKSFNNNNNTIGKNSSSSHQYQSFIGRLVSKDNILLISQNVIEIGRNSSKSSVDFHVGKNSFVSRKHLILHYDGHDFNLVCASKNGVFIDDQFIRKSNEPTRLPSSCTLRFPSTNIRIQFENLVDQNRKHDSTAGKSTSVENTNTVYRPLKISIPEQESGALKNIKSPFPSPTGTMSAANSCPTSPRHNYHDIYSQHNNGSHSFNEEFTAPSTSGEYEKPPYSYAQLIVQSITAAPDKQLTLSGIYSYISKHYPYYRTGANKGWQNSIRHNLSLNRYFIKVPRSQDEPGKGSFWRIDPMCENKLIDQSYRKRRQRGNQSFRAPFGMPRSAPVSPSLIDNSQENSPQELNDVILQSAPQSPGSMNYSGSDRNTSYNSQYTSFVIPSNNNSLKREREVEYEETYEYSDDEEYVEAKRMKEEEV